MYSDQLYSGKKRMKKIVLTSFVLLLLLAGVFLHQWLRFNDGKLHIIFCNVGQGDGILIRTPSGLDIVEDGGPDNSILNCLSRHMPFWDRKIELVFLSHPHADHMIGIVSILNSYKVSFFATEELSNATSIYKKLAKILQDKNLRTQYIYARDSFQVSDGLSFKILGPSKEFTKRTSPNGKIGETKEFASLISLVSFGEFDLLLSGDSQLEGLKEALAADSFGPIEVFQIPHHGSKYGTDLEVLDILKPKLAVISVGKNKYGHPTKFILDLLAESNIKTLRTDEDGDIEIVVDKNGQFKIH